MKANIKFPFCNLLPLGKTAVDAERQTGYAGEAEKERITMNDKTTDIRTLPYNRKLKERAKEMRKAGMLHEALLWKQLKNGQINGLDFHRQQIIGSYIVDFFSPDGFVIEADGSSHNDKVEYDENRDKYLSACGLKVIHISVKDILNNMNGVVRYLKEQTASGRHTPSGKHTPSGDSAPATPLRKGNCR